MNIQTHLDPDILEAAKMAADAEGVTLSEYLRKLLREDMEARSPAKREAGEEDGQDS